MSKVSQFRKKCKEKNFDYIDEFLRDDSHDLVENSKVVFFQKLSGIFRRYKKSNVQIVASQIKWYFRKFHKYDILEHIFSDNIDYSSDDLQILLDSFIDACKTTKLDISNLSCQKYIERCMPIMNLERFKNVHSYLIDNALKKIKQIVHSYLIDNALKKMKQLDKEIEDDKYNDKWHFITTDYIYPINDIIWKFLEKGDKDSSQELCDIICEDREKIGMYWEYCDVIGNTVFPCRFIYNTPKELHDAYRLLINLNFSKGRIQNANVSSYTFFCLKSCFDNLSWTRNDYKSFFDLCSNGEEINKVDIPIVFFIIDSFKNSKKQNTEAKEYIRSFIEKHKKEYFMWLINDCNGLSVFEQLNTARLPIFTDNDIEVFGIIISELIKRQKEKNIDLFDVSYLGAGGSSVAYKIGDYVVKVGHGRVKIKIPNHRRILQPIIRLKNENAFIEVADYVETREFSYEEYKKIYYELLADGYVWDDANRLNLGFLKRKNVPRHGIKRIIKTEDGVKIIDDESSSDEKATNIIGDIDGEPLQRGEVVILDTDHIYKLNDPEVLKKIISREGKYMDSEIREKINKRLEVLERRIKEEDKSEMNR